MLESFPATPFLNLHSCGHPRNLILKLQNTVSQLVILEGGGERGKKWRASVGGRLRMTLARL